MATQTRDRNCPVCGKDVAESDFKRFGKWACTAAHADAYVKAVRAEKLRVVQPEPRGEKCCG